MSSISNAINVLTSPATTAVLDLAKGGKAGYENANVGTPKSNQFLNKLALFASGMGLGAFVIQKGFSTKAWAPDTLFHVKHAKSQMALFGGMAAFAKEMGKEKKDPWMLALAGGSAMTGGASLALDMYKHPVLDPKQFAQELNLGKYALASKNGLAIAALTTYMVYQHLAKSDDQPKV